jgi:hypothetical protein
MTDKNVARCESCGSWTYLNDLDKLMGHPHLCITCKERKKGLKRAS